MTRIAKPADANSGMVDHTLVCYVLVDPQGGHAFCSRYDFGPWPLLSGVSALPPTVSSTLRSTAAVFINGFVFDELPLDLVTAAIATAAAEGAVVLFDPGPRAFTMRDGARRAALDTLLDLSEVVLMTSEEASQVTGLEEPTAAAEAVLARPGAQTRWCVVKLGADGALLAARDAEGGIQLYTSGAFKVRSKRDHTLSLLS